MRTVIGIDIGGSTTKIVGLRSNGAEQTLIEPIFVRATDAITSVYGAFGKFTMQNGLALEDIDRVLMTGVGSAFIDKPLYSLKCEKVSEFTSVGNGGLYLSGLDEAIVVSMGTGTALVPAKNDGSLKYLGGTGVGGGTLLGLSKKMLGTANVDNIVELASTGDISKVDLRVSDISRKDIHPDLAPDLTASNFGKLSDLATRHDISLGIVNMVTETVAMMAIFAARSFNISDIVLTGNLTSMAPVRNVFDSLKLSFGVNFIIPKLSQYGPVIGSALQ